MNGPDYLAIARKDDGLTEIKGEKTANRITEMLVKLGAWWRDDETPWCGVALAAWLKEAGLPIPKAYYRALAWLEYGEPVGSPLTGAIAVFSRTGGGHVGIVTGSTQDGKYIRVLGGNQDNRVCEVWFPMERVAGFRKPKGVILDWTTYAIRGQLSRSEA